MVFEETESVRFSNFNHPVTPLLSPTGNSPHFFPLPLTNLPFFFLKKTRPNKTNSKIQNFANKIRNFMDRNIKLKDLFKYFFFDNPILDTSCTNCEI